VIALGEHQYHGALHVLGVLWTTTSSGCRAYGSAHLGFLDPDLGQYGRRLTGEPKVTLAA
jgi:hypothetical protein